MNWDKMKVTLYTKWDVGGKLFLVAPNGGHARFWLSSTGSNTYKVHFYDGYMHDCWHRCLDLHEMGTQDPPAVSGLPPLDDNDPELDAEYELALQDVYALLQKDDTDLRRLESQMTVPYKGRDVQDRVRMLYLEKVVPVPNGDPEDLVLVCLAPVHGGLQENGGASGPPK